MVLQPNDWLDVAAFEEKVHQYTSRQADGALSTGLLECIEIGLLDTTTSIRSKEVICP